MSIFLCCAFLIILGVVILKTELIKDKIDNTFCGGLLTTVSSIVLFIALILIPITRMQTYSEIKQFRSIQQSIANAREDKQHFGNFNIENAALQQEVIKANRWLVSVKYWKTTTFSLWIPDEINNLSEIK